VVVVSVMAFWRPSLAPVVVSDMAFWWCILGVWWLFLHCGGVGGLNFGAFGDGALQVLGLYYSQVMGLTDSCYFTKVVSARCSDFCLV
jgi:hypothetical protein